MLAFLSPYMIAIKLFAVAAVFAAGVGVAMHFEGASIDQLNQKLGASAVTIKTMTDDISSQNKAIQAIKDEAAQRQALADKAIADAKQGQRAAELRASDILMSKPPRGSNKCLAASRAFDAELRSERAK